MKPSTSNKWGCDSWNINCCRYGDQYPWDHFCGMNTQQGLQSVKKAKSIVRQRVYHLIYTHIISYHIISYHIISYHIISYCNIISYYNIISSYHIILQYNIISYIITCCIMSYIILYPNSWHLQHVFSFGRTDLWTESAERSSPRRLSRCGTCYERVAWGPGGLG